MNKEQLTKLLTDFLDWVDLVGRNHPMQLETDNDDIAMMYLDEERADAIINKKELDENGLLPCPFCGSKPNFGSLGGDKQNFLIWCDCQMAESEMGINGETRDQITESWNKRI